jgi:hypothetical protein
VPPPHGSTLRVSRHPNARFLFSCPVPAEQFQLDYAQEAASSAV